MKQKQEHVMHFSACRYVDKKRRIIFKLRTLEEKLVNPKRKRECKHTKPWKQTVSCPIVLRVWGHSWRETVREMRSDLL